MTILWFILVLILIVSISIILWQLSHRVYGQTVPPPASVPTGPANQPAAALPTPVPPTVVPTPTPTAPNPNFQYLPQKAYVQAYGPEIGIPTNGVPLQQAPTVIAASPTQGGIDTGSIMGIIGTVVAAGSGLVAKMSHDKSKQVQQITRENSSAIVDSKVVQQEIARYMFNLDKAKADALNDAPAIKLEKLEDDKKVATDTASKA